jgi:hypothetical protein
VKPDVARSSSLIRRVESIAKPLSRRGGLAVFVFGVGKEGRVVIFQRKVARPRREAVHAGWNDAAWSRPHRQLEPALAQSYESGYAGGLVFREKQQVDLLQRAVVSKPLPRRAPAA